MSSPVLSAPLFQRPATRLVSAPALRHFRLSSSMYPLSLCLLLGRLSPLKAAEPEARWRSNFITPLPLTHPAITRQLGGGLLCPLPDCFSHTHRAAPLPPGPVQLGGKPPKPQDSSCSSTPPPPRYPRPLSSATPKLVAVDVRIHCALVLSPALSAGHPTGAGILLCSCCGFLRPEACRPASRDTCSVE